MVVVFRGHRQDAWNKICNVCTYKGSVLVNRYTSIVDASFKVISQNMGYQLHSSYTESYVNPASASKNKTFCILPNRTHRSARLKITTFDPIKQKTPCYCN